MDYAIFGVAAGSAAAQTIDSGIDFGVGAASVLCPDHWDFYQALIYWVGSSQFLPLLE